MQRYLGHRAGVPGIFLLTFCVGGDERLEHERRQMASRLGLVTD